MPSLTRPDGIEIHYEVAGEGPVIAVAGSWWSPPAGTFGALLDDLASDHTIVTYDARGSGESTRTGPYDPRTDAEDFAAVLEVVAPVALVLSFGDGSLRAVRAAAARLDSIGAVVAWGNPLGPAAMSGTDSIAASEAVIEAFEGMLRTSFRSAMNQILTALNPQFSAEEVIARVDQAVEYSDAEAGIARTRVNIEDGAPEECEAIGDKLWIVNFEGNPLLTDDVAERMHALVPAAQIRWLADGAVSRPDLTAAIVRKITARDRARA